MSSPILLLEMWELLEQHARASTLEPLYDLADVLMRPIAEEHVHMVSRHLARDDVQIVVSRNLPQQVPAARSRSGENGLAVLCPPDNVNLQVVLGVSAHSISSHRATSSTLSFA